jgi:hypothetical protein
LSERRRFVNLWNAPTLLLKLGDFLLLIGDVSR